MTRDEVLAIVAAAREKNERVDLCGADLRKANLRGTDLCEANLRKADLREANLRKANLCEADLCRADLRDADMSEADLRGADLNGIKTNYLTIGIHPAPEGKLIGWGKKYGRIIKMEIPEDSPRSCATTRKFRCHFADVLEIDGKTTGKIEHSWDGSHVTIYEVGKRVYADSWDADRWNECLHGIHFFLTREEAEAWNQLLEAL